MTMVIQPMSEADREPVLAMMRRFYRSDAVLTNGSEVIFERDFENCVSESPYLEGFVFREQEEIQGYAMIAKSFSTEFGCPCIWIEDLYVKKPFRGEGIGSGFLQYIRERFPEALLRLESERENRRAIAVYEKNGFVVFDYQEMIQRP